MTRIKADNVQFGENYVLPIDQSTAIKQAENQRRFQEAKDLCEKIVQDAKAQAEEILEKANSEANQTIELAKSKGDSEYESIKQKAYEEGFTKGLEDGTKKSQEDMLERVNALDTLLKSEIDAKQNIVKSAEKDIVDLVKEISLKVCKKSIDEKILLEITSDAIKSLKDKEQVTIIVNPELSNLIYNISEELKVRIPQLESIKIIEDLAVSPDGTIVESILSRVDARVSSQINVISESLINGLNSSDELQQE